MNSPTPTRPGSPARQAVAGRGRVARRSWHRRVDDAQRPAHREPERRSSASITGVRRAGDGAGPHLRRRPTNWNVADLPPDDLLRPAAGRARCTGRSRPSGRSNQLLPARANLRRPPRAVPAPQAAKRVRRPRCELSGPMRGPVRPSGAAPWATWPNREALLVCVGPSPTTARKSDPQRRKQLAGQLSTPRGWRCSVRAAGASIANPVAAQRVADHLRLARANWGPTTVTLTAIGGGVPPSCDYARDAQPGHQAVRSAVRPWQPAVAAVAPHGRGGTQLLAEAAASIDVYLIQVALPTHRLFADDAGGRRADAADRPRSPGPATWWPRRPGNGAASLVATPLVRRAAGWPRLNVVMVYLLPVVLTAVSPSGSAVARRCWASGGGSVLLFDLSCSCRRTLFVRRQPTSAVPRSPSP